VAQRLNDVTTQLDLIDAKLRSLERDAAEILKVLQFTPHHDDGKTNQTLCRVAGG
jgi:hypothetical protein